MRFRVLRGSNEIGGNCIQVEASGSSILLDLGQPLRAKVADRSLVPAVDGLLAGDNPGLLGIVISHPHMDHFGLVGFSHASLPIFIGEKAHTLVRSAAPFTGTELPDSRISHYHHRQPFTIGPFLITPFLMDHSAFDAYAFLIEGGGKKLFYTGDFRGHGRKARYFEALLEAPPPEIDVLLTEGTTLGRAQDEGAQTEEQLEDEILNSIRLAKGIVLACFSGQNIDRFVTFYKATKRAGRTFIADVYLASILDALSLSSLPSARVGAMRVFLPLSQKRRIIRSKRFDLIDPFRATRIYPTEIADTPERWVMIFRASMIDDIARMGGDPKAKLIYSLWPGYLEQGEPDLRTWSSAHGIEFEICHTSGHADEIATVKLIESLRPKCVVPIHTVRPERFVQLAPKVVQPSNGVWMSV